MLDPDVTLALAVAAPAETRQAVVKHDEEQAHRLARKLEVLTIEHGTPDELVRLASEGRYDLIVTPLPDERLATTGLLSREWTDYILEHTHCRVFLAARQVIPTDVEE